MTATQDSSMQLPGLNPAPILELKGMTSGYGTQAVVHGLDIVVRPGEVVALLGPNGAGKTTTLLSVSGELPLMSGEVLIDGEVTKTPLHRRARAGLAFITEEKSVFMSLTTRDNLVVGGVTEEQAYAVFPELEKRIDVRGGLLSGGEQQMLTVARALSRSPRLLLADELSLGLAPLIVKRLLQAVRDAADQKGTGVLLVEQHVRKALLYADRAYVLRRGRVVMEGTAADMLRRIDEVEASYLASGPSS